MSFAKLFESESLGQILVMKDTNDDVDPCVTVMFDPKIEGFENIKVGLGFEDDERRDRVWNDITLERAESVVRSALRDAGLPI